MVPPGSLESSLVKWTRYTTGYRPTSGGGMDGGSPWTRSGACWNYGRICAMTGKWAIYSDTWPPLV